MTTQRPFIDLDRLAQGPPEYPHDVESVWISEMDPAWDNTRGERERVILTEDELAKLFAEKRSKLHAAATKKQKQAAGEATEDEQRIIAGIVGLRHPVGQWYTCATAFSLDAPLTVPECLRTEERPSPTVTIREYLTAPPVEFVIRSLDAEPYRRVRFAPVHEQSLWRVKLGLLRLRIGSKIVEPAREADGAITDAWVNWLDLNADRSLIDRLGQAIFMLSNARGGEAEKKL